VAGVLSCSFPVCRVFFFFFYDFRNSILMMADAANKFISQKTSKEMMNEMKRMIKEKNWVFVAALTAGPGPLD